MNNSDMPAMPMPGYHETNNKGSRIVIDGLTKREQFCLTMGVAATGDKELDAIIREGNEQKVSEAYILETLKRLSHEDFESTINTLLAKLRGKK